MGVTYLIRSINNWFARKGKVALVVGKIGDRHQFRASFVVTLRLSGIGASPHFPWQLR